MAHFIYSTLSAGVNYTDWKKEGSDLPTKGHHVAIRGGANIADKHLMTPKGVVTEVSDEDMEFLKSHPIFQLHVKNGFINHEQREMKIEKGVEGLQEKDKSAPETPENLAKKKAAQKKQE